MTKQIKIRSIGEPIDPIMLGCNKQQANIFELFRSFGMSPKEIARKTGIHETKVRNLIVDVWLRDKEDWSAYKKDEKDWRRRIRDGYAADDVPTSDGLTFI